MTKGWFLIGKGGDEPLVSTFIFSDFTNLIQLGSYFISRPMRGKKENECTIKEGTHIWLAKENEGVQAIGWLSISNHAHLSAIFFS